MNILTTTEQGTLLTYLAVATVALGAVFIYLALRDRRPTPTPAVLATVAQMTANDRALYTETYLVTGRDLGEFRQLARANGMFITASAPVLGGTTYAVTVGAMLTFEDAWEAYYSGDLWDNRVH